MMDLLSREGRQQVGCRMSDIVCSKDKVTIFDRRVKKAQFTGLTRIEISICMDAFGRFNPWLPSVRTAFHTKMQVALSMIITNVLNEPTIFGMAYRKLKLAVLLGLLS